MPDFMDHFLSSIKTIFELRDFHIAGKLDMQKSFYFAKELGLPVYFKFRWGKLGPFSNELSNTLSLITNKRFITYNGNYILEDKNFRYIESLDIPIKVNSFFNNLNKITSRKGITDIFFIETISSIHFLYKYSNIKKKDDVIRKLKELKPDRVTMLEPYFDMSWEFLKDNKLIT